jgi:hypothetical protein
VPRVESDRVGSCLFIKHVGLSHVFLVLGQFFRIEFGWVKKYGIYLAHELLWIRNCGSYLPVALVGSG